MSIELAGFAHRLRSFGNNAALITGNSVISYEALHGMASRAAETIGHRRRLVFLEAASTPAAIATYLGCLIGGHPVYLFNTQEGEKTARLRDLYRPNRVYALENGVFDLVDSHDDTIELHPALRVLLATSGSTGSPKLVKLSESNIESNANAIVEYLRLNDTERALTTLKFNYSYGMSVVNSHMACGGALVLTDHSVLDEEFWETFRETRATSFAGVPYTFETLHRAGAALDAPHLRYLTQAGGKLAPDLVRYFADLAQSRGWRFYVMYGQTEAAPRMAYLPPEQAASYPECMGVAIPGGRLYLLDAQGHEIEEADTPGELAYSGPNIMLGYANGVAGLCTDDTPARLLTGDIACRNPVGLFYITGRASRFVKPFGVRVNLDDIQAEVRKWSRDAACAASGETIVIALKRAEMPDHLEAHVNALGSLYRLPRFAFQILEVDDIPRLANGKTDYRALSELASNRAAPSSGSTKAAAGESPLATIFSKQFAGQMRIEFLRLLGLGGQQWSGVAHIYTTVFGGRAVTADNTFVGLAGDSLSYVQASVAIEEYLGHVPAKWEHLTVGELEQLHSEAASI